MAVHINYKNQDWIEDFVRTKLTEQNYNDLAWVWAFYGGLNIRDVLGDILGYKRVDQDDEEPYIDRFAYLDENGEIQEDRYRILMTFYFLSNEFFEAKVLKKAKVMMMDFLDIEVDEKST